MSKPMTFEERFDKWVSEQAEKHEAGMRGQDVGLKGQPLLANIKYQAGCKDLKPIIIEMRDVLEICADNDHANDVLDRLDEFFGGGE